MKKMRAALVAALAAGVLFASAPRSDAQLDNGVLKVDISGLSGAINLASFGGSDFYNPGTPVSWFGFQRGTDVSSTANNANDLFGGVGTPVVVSSAGGALGSVSVLGSYSGGGASSILFHRVYTIDAVSAVLHITTTLTHVGLDPVLLRYFDSHDPDQGIDQGNGFGTFNDVYADGSETVGESIEDGGLFVQFRTPTAGGGIIASGGPFSLFGGFDVNGFFASPVDGGGSFEDAGMHIGFEHLFTLGSSITVSYDQVFGFGPPPNVVPEPGTYAMLAGMGVSGLLFLRRRRK